jgi:hypothetical protein
METFGIWWGREIPQVNPTYVLLNARWNNLYVRNEIPVVALSDVLRATLIFLQNEQNTHQRLRLFDDWREHDAFIFRKGL